RVLERAVDVEGQASARLKETVVAQAASGEVQLGTRRTRGDHRGISGIIEGTGNIDGGPVARLHDTRIAQFADAHIDRTPAECTGLPKEGRGTLVRVRDR